MKKSFILIAIASVLSVTTYAQETYALTDLKKLKWLEGKWKGAAKGEQPFYEQYKFLNDSTWAMLYFKDASFSGKPIRVGFICKKTALFTIQVTLYGS